MEKCERQGCTASGDTYYLFDADTLQPIGEPSEVKEDLFASTGDERQPPGTWSSRPCTASSAQGASRSSDP